MANELDPLVNQWYSHLDKGQRFYVVAVDDTAETVETQYFDGSVEELGLDEWRGLDIELSEAPENWSGALDIDVADDLGTDITDTRAEDWNEPGEDYRDPDRERMSPEEAIDDSPGGLKTASRGVELAGVDVNRRMDGKYEEKLNEDWLAEYDEDPATGLWEVELFKHDTSEWRDSGYATLQEAREAAEDYYDQQ